MRLARFLALSLALASPLAAQTARDTAHVAAIVPSLDTLSGPVAASLAKACALASAPAYLKTACQRFTRSVARIKTSEVLLVGVTPTPTPVPPPVVITGATLAELPRSTPSTTYPTGGRSVAVGNDLQAALNAAVCGDVLLLAPGSTYTGSYTLPATTCTGWIVVRTNVSLPAEGTRMTPSLATSLKLARIQTPGSNQEVFGTAPSAHHWRLTGLDIGIAPTAGDINTLVRFGADRSTQSNLATVPHDLILDRSYVHGTATHNLRRCVALNSGTAAVVDSWLTDCHDHNGDSQAILGYNGPGPFLIQNNTLEGGAENVMFGGGDPASEAFMPQDITVRGNYIHRPASWRGVWYAKNLFETKNAKRVLLEGNVLDGNWADAQTGFAFQLKSENQDNTAPYTTSSDLTIRYNIIRNTGSVFNISGTGSSTNANVPAARFTITDNWATGINDTTTIYTGGGGVVVQILSDMRDAVILHNTFENASWSGSSVSFDGVPATRLVMQGNAWYSGLYGVHGSGTGVGIAALTAYAPGAVFTDNLIVGAGCGMYPPTTVCPATWPTAWPLAADGKPIGADVAKVQAMTAGAVVQP